MKTKKTKTAKGVAWLKGNLIVYLPYSVVVVPKELIKKII